MTLRYIITACAKNFSKPPKNTVTFTWEIFRLLLKFLQKFEPDMLWVIILTFDAALRTGELIKSEKHDFLFGHDDRRKYVVVTLREPKTRKNQLA